MGWVSGCGGYPLYLRSLNRMRVCYCVGLGDRCGVWLNNGMSMSIANVLSYG